MSLINQIEIQNILLQEIEKSFDEISNNFNNEIFMKGYNNVYKYFILTKLNKFEKFINLFSKVTYKKARKYNNLNTNDKITYSIEIDRIMKMCMYWKIYYQDSYQNKLENIIIESWDKAEKYKIFNLIGCICVINNLPTGEIFLPKKIGSYVYSIDNFDKHEIKK